MVNEAHTPAATEETTKMTTAEAAERVERQRIAAEMARWFGIGITRVHTSDDDEDADEGTWNRWEV